MKKILLFLILNFNLFSIEYIPYQGKLKEIETEHFKVIFSEVHTKSAILISEYAEDIHNKISKFLDWKPEQKTIIILTDHTDLPNGLAYTYNRNTIVVYLTHSDLEISLKSYENPLYSLLLHEYTHIIHLDNVRNGALFWRIFYGRSLFPNLLAFSFFIEGIAVLSESIFAGGGRLSSTYNHSIIREAIINNKLPSFDKLVYPVIDWPYGDAIYHYGARFVLYLYNFYGREKLIEFINSIGSDFIPLMFVIRFKKIYGKSLKDLWNEWLEYEKSNFKIEDKKDKKPIIDLEGSILDFTKYKEKIYISTSSYKYDNTIYEYKDNSLKKIKNVYSNNIKCIDNILFYTSFNSYRDDFFYSDLYFYDLKKKSDKRLTFNKRVTSFDYFDKKIIFVSHSANGSILYMGDFVNNKIKNIKKLPFDEKIFFIDQINLDSSQKRLVFGARKIDNERSIFMYDIENKETKSLNIAGLSPKWLSEDEIVLISEDMKKIYKYSISKDQIFEIYESNSCITNLYVYNNEIFYLEYGVNGEKLFILKEYEEKLAIINRDILSEKEIEEIRIEDYKIKNYCGLNYLEPSLWFYLPTTINSQFYIENIPFSFIAPQYSITNFTPENRFSYTISITYDYINQYPENSISLSFRFPYFNIYYYWYNWVNSYKIFYNNRWYSNKNFSISLLNSVTLYFPISLASYGDISLSSNVTHIFRQNNITNLNFSNSFTYYWIKKSFSSSRWDKGVLSNIDFYFSPDILNNKEYYILNFSFIFRMPLKRSFFYLNLDSGINLLQEDTFFVDSNIINLEGLLDNSSSFIDTKAFSYAINKLDISGFFYVSMDIGFDITIYKKSHYWHFLTMGFKELYFKIYNEFVYILPNNLKHNILFDTVFQLNLDLFLIYGNLPLNLAIGGSIGYLVGDVKPSWGIFFYLSTGINLSTGNKKNLDIIKYKDFI